MKHQDVKPRLQSRVVRYKKNGKYLFLDPDKPDWIVTNRNGATALSLCNGRRTFFQIAQKISAAAREDLSEQVVGFLKNVYENNSILKSYSSENTFYHPLRILQLTLTQECNLNCIYCYAASRTQTDKKDYLSEKEFKSLIDEANEISKSVGVILTGGEPLLSSHCLAIGRHAAKHGNYPHLLTNALLVGQGNAQDIANVFSLVKISIDGSCPEYHDLHRGAGTFKRVINSVELLDKYGANISISMTVTKKNINDIERMVSLFGNRLSFQPLFSAGRGADINIGITGSEYYSALSSVKGVNPLANLSSTLESSKNGGIYKCAIGDSEISISETGDVYPCQLLHVPEFFAGNIRKSSLKDIYHSSKVLEKCRKLDVYRVEGCKGCSIRLICGGACRARAFYEKGKIDVSGDFCEYEKKAIINGIFESYEI